MEKKRINIEDLSRDNRGGYTVPDGYFSDLNHRITENAARPAQGGKWATFRSMLTFASGFAAMVIMAITGYYFTGHKAQIKETENEEFYLVNLYNISTEDIIDYNISSGRSSETFTSEAAVDYLATYGYDLTEITE